MVRRLVVRTHKKIQYHYWQNALMIRRFVRKKIQCQYWLTDLMIWRFVRKKLSRVTSCWTWPGPNIWGNLSWKGLVAQLMTKSNYLSGCLFAFSLSCIHFFPSFFLFLITFTLFFFSVTTFDCFPLYVT